MSANQEPKKKQSAAKPQFKDAQPDLKVTETVQERLARLEAEMEIDAERKVKITDQPKSDLPAPVKQQKQAAKEKPSKTKEKEIAVVTGGGDAASQLSFMHDPRWNMTAFWVIVVLSVLLANVPIVNLLLTPVNQFVTMVHELGHAFAAVLTGGHVIGLTIAADGQGHGGLTFTEGGWNFLITQAGYVGTTLFGCLLIYLGQYPRFSKLILSALGVCMILSTIVFIVPGLLNPLHFLESVISLIWGFGMGAVCFWLGRKLKPAMANLMVLFLAVQTTLSSLSLLWVLVPHSLGLAGGGFSDATAMAKMVPFTLPIFWVFWWVSISIIALFFTLKHTYGSAVMKKRIQKKL